MNFFSDSLDSSLSLVQAQTLVMTSLCSSEASIYSDVPSSLRVSYGSSERLQSVLFLLYEREGDYLLVSVIVLYVSFILQLCLFSTDKLFTSLLVCYLLEGVCVGFQLSVLCDCQPLPMELWDIMSSCESSFFLEGILNLRDFVVWFHFLVLLQ